MDAWKATFLLGRFGLFSGVFAVSFREGIWYKPGCENQGSELPVDFGGEILRVSCGRPPPQNDSRKRVDSAVWAGQGQLKNGGNGALLKLDSIFWQK